MRHLRSTATATTPSGATAVGGPKQIVTGLVLVTTVAALTGLMSPGPGHHRSPPPPASAEAGGAPSAPMLGSTTTTAVPTPTAPATTTTGPEPAAAAPAPVPAPAEPVVAATAPAPPAEPAAAAVGGIAAVGVYAGAANPSGAAAFGAATATHVTVVEDYLPDTSWNDIDGAGGSLDWMLDAWRGSGYQLVLGVPLFDDSGTDTLAAGAVGAYDTAFVTLATTLVGAGQGGAIVRLGPEFTGNWNPWRVTDETDAVDYAAYFRHIVTAMRSVPGQAFRFIWEGADPEDGSYPGAYGADASYPGDAYVDYVGNDTYDQSWNGGCGLGFDNTATAAQAQCAWDDGTLPALTRVAYFALAHHKPVVFPEWGLAIRADGHGLGDDPTFVAQMAAWIASHDVSFAIYFDFDVPGQLDAITDGRFPTSLAAYRAAFG